MTSPTPNLPTAGVDQSVVPLAATRPPLLPSAALHHAALLDDAGLARLTLLVDDSALPLSIEQSATEVRVYAVDGHPLAWLGEAYVLPPLRLIVTSAGRVRVDTSPAGHRS